MSHYAIAVFSNRPMDAEFDRLLEPYSETDEKYFVFEPVSDEQLLEKWEKFRKHNPNWTYSNWLQEMFTLRDGQYGYFYNPNAKYDYYSLDARSDMYDLTSEAASHQEYPDYYMKSQINWFPTDEYDEAHWRKCWEEYKKGDGDSFFSFRYYEERYGTREQFVKEMMRPPAPYAFVTPDGKWHAPGKVGWFAISDETAESADAYWEEWCEFIRNAPDCYVSLVDCHI